MAPNTTGRMYPLHAKRLCSPRRILALHTGVTKHHFFKFVANVFLKRFTLSCGGRPRQRHTTIANLWGEAQNMNELAQHEVIQRIGRG